MPITKQDIQGFGDTLRNTLAIWGEQIQQGRDYAKLKKVQNQLANVKNFTTDASGNPLGYEDITKKMMGINSQLSDIRTPEVMKLAQMNVSDFVTKNIAGLTQDVQNKFNIGMDKIQNPNDAPKVAELTKDLPKGMYQFKPGVADKHYASKIIHEAIVDGNGNVDRQYVNQYALITTARGGVQKVFLGKIDRTKANVIEQEQWLRDKMQNEITLKGMTNKSSVFHNSPRKFDLVQSPKGTGIFDERRGQVSYDSGKTWETPVDIQRYTGTGVEKEQINTIEKQYEEANKIVKNRFNKDEIDALYEAMNTRTLFRSPYWNRLSDYEKNLLKATILSDYFEYTWNKEWYQKNNNDSEDNLF